MPQKEAALLPAALLFPATGRFLEDQADELVAAVGDPLGDA
jgi:hypothetical protein